MSWMHYCLSQLGWWSCVYQRIFVESSYLGCEADHTFPSDSEV
jgi:hypothetical protein